AGWVEAAFGSTKAGLMVGLAAVSPVMVTGVPPTWVHFQPVLLVDPLPSRARVSPRASEAVTGAMIAVGVAFGAGPPAEHGAGSFPWTWPARAGSSRRSSRR